MVAIPRCMGFIPNFDITRDCYLDQVRAISQERGLDIAGRRALVSPQETAIRVKLELSAKKALGSQAEDEGQRLMSWLGKTPAFAG